MKDCIEMEKLRTELNHCIISEPYNYKKILQLSEELDVLILQYYHSHYIAEEVFL